MIKATPTSPLIKEGKTLKRKFTGKTDGFENKHEKSFYERMLKSYIKGAQVFGFGFTTNAFGQRVRKKYNVQQEYYYS